MGDILNFMGDHWFLTWLLAWGIWPICATVGAVLTAPFVYGFRAYNRRMRSLNIRAKGWPTNPLMDADGDIVHPPAPKQEEPRVTIRMDRDDGYQPKFGHGPVNPPSGGSGGRRG